MAIDRPRDAIQKEAALAPRRRYVGSLALVGVLLLVFANRDPSLADSSPDIVASFDCAKASTPDEEAICANAHLAHLDRIVAEAYAEFIPDRRDKLLIGRELLADRHACGRDEVCIAAVEANALDTYLGYLTGLPSWVDAYVQALVGERAEELAGTAAQDQDQPVPQRIGDCAMTQITKLTTRFGGTLSERSDPMIGSAVIYKNGGEQISYSKRDVLLDGPRRGDPVVVCLISTSRDCPGDPPYDLGRDYYTHDVRTGQAWTMSGTAKDCGG